MKKIQIGKIFAIKRDVRINGLKIKMGHLAGSVDIERVTLDLRVLSSSPTPSVGVKLTLKKKKKNGLKNQKTL